MEVRAEPCFDVGSPFRGWHCAERWKNGNGCASHAADGGTFSRRPGVQGGIRLKRLAEMDLSARGRPC